MKKIDWQSRLRNKAFWIALASAIILLIQQLGFDYILPHNAMDIVNTVLLIFTIMGVVIDPSTPTMYDQPPKEDTPKIEK